MNVLETISSILHNKNTRFIAQCILLYGACYLLYYCTSVGQDAKDMGLASRQLIPPMLIFYVVQRVSGKTLLSWLWLTQFLTGMGYDDADPHVPAGWQYGNVPIAYGGYPLWLLCGALPHVGPAAHSRTQALPPFPVMYDYPFHAAHVHSPLSGTPFPAVRTVHYGNDDSPLPDTGLLAAPHEHHSGYRYRAAPHRRHYLLLHWLLHFQI